MENDGALVQYIVYLWLIAGALMIAFEAFAVPGIGFLFGGLGAIVTAGAIMAGAVERDDLLLQFTWWFATTAIWAAVLWKPIKQLRVGGIHGGKDIEYKNIVGTTAVVSKEGLKKGRAGTALWSGTTMSARIAEDCPVEELEPKTEVEVIEVRGITLIVCPPGMASGEASGDKKENAPEETPVRNPADPAKKSE